MSTANPAPDRRPPRIRRRTAGIALAMHKGMDGPHLFRVTVPTTHPNLPAISYTVKGDFR